MYLAWFSIRNGIWDMGNLLKMSPGKSFATKIRPSEKLFDFLTLL